MPGGRGTSVSDGEERGGAREEEFLFPFFDGGIRREAGGAGRQFRFMDHDDGRALLVSADCDMFAYCYLLRIVPALYRSPGVVLSVRSCRSSEQLL
mmetsp:Transcript_50647/g.99039  ORF Transcript_50647/g.99039 Transcript_50647/m.99039 type:complete len:96 (+) Transcript_50647:582-869(+)